MSETKQLFGAAKIAAENKAKANSTSKKAMLPPIPKGGIIYRVPNLTVDPVTNRPSTPAIQGIPPEDEIFVLNEESNRKELVPLVFSAGTTTRKNSDGSYTEVPVKGEINLIMGQIVVYPEMLKLYEYLERCNYNGSNPDRNTKKPILFERVDPVAKKIASLSKEKELFLAKQQLFEMWEQDKSSALEYATGLGIDMEQDDDIILAELMQRLNADPQKFIANSVSAMRQVKAIVKKAENLEVIKYSAGVNKWFWADKSEIATVPPGVTDAFGFFCEWLIRFQENNTYDLIKQQVEQSEAGK